MTIVFFDTETCGLTDDCPTIQIAAVAVAADDQWDELATFERKIKFENRPEYAEALALNSFNSERWEQEAIAERLALAQFCEFLRPYCTVDRVSKGGKPYRVAMVGGHNAATFDHPRISARCREFGNFLPTDWPVLDTMQLAGWFFMGQPKPKSFRLPDLCEHFGIPVADAHDALADARMSARLAQEIIQRSN